MRPYRDLTPRQQREKDEREASRSNFSKILLEKTKIDLCERSHYIPFTIITMSIATPIVIVLTTWWFRLWFMLL